VSLKICCLDKAVKKATLDCQKLPDSVMDFEQNQMKKGHYALNFHTLKAFRQQMYARFERGADVLFNLCDTLLCEWTCQN
jgi:hypothetical protein